ncbi:disulfide isomerase-like protein 2-3, partial [Tanacetum coccineum]
GNSDSAHIGVNLNDEAADSEDVEAQEVPATIGRDRAKKKGSSSGARSETSIAGDPSLVDALFSKFTMAATPFFTQRKESSSEYLQIKECELELKERKRQEQGELERLRIRVALFLNLEVKLYTAGSTPEHALLLVLQHKRHASTRGSRGITSTKVLPLYLQIMSAEEEVASIPEDVPPSAVPEDELPSAVPEDESHPGCPEDEPPRRSRRMSHHPGIRRHHSFLLLRGDDEKNLLGWRVLPHPDANIAFVLKPTEDVRPLMVAASSSDRITKDEQDLEGGSIVTCRICLQCNGLEDNWRLLESAYLADKHGFLKKLFNNSWDRILSRHPIPIYYCVVEDLKGHYTLAELDPEHMERLKTLKLMCGHCKKLAPEWKKAAKNLQGKVKLGHVNCDDEKSLMSRYKVADFPTILVFGADKESPLIYEGARSASAIESFALIMLETNVAPPEVTKLTSPDVMERRDCTLQCVDEETSSIVRASHGFVEKPFSRLAFVYFEDKCDVEEAINALNNTSFGYYRRMMVREEIRQGALGKIMADEVIVLLGGQLVPIVEANQALTMVVLIADQALIKASWTLESSKLRAKTKVLKRNIRQYGREDLEPLSLRDLKNVEQQLETSLKQIRKKEDKESPLIYEGARSTLVIESFALIMLETNVAPPEVTELTSPVCLVEIRGTE